MKTTETTVIITGAAGGIGRALTQRFLNDGSKVCAVDISIKVLEKLSDDLGNPGNLFCVVGILIVKKVTKTYM